MTHVSHCVDSYIEKKGCVRVLSVILSWSILYATVQVIMLELIIFVVAYLLGSVPFGKIIAWKWYHVDIQKRGSGNIGFANMLGILGWKAAVPTLVGDVSKGAAAARAAFAASCADRGEKSGSNTGTGPPSTARAVSESGCSR